MVEVVVRINLATTDGVSVPVPVGSGNQVGISIVPGSTFGTSWIVDVQRSVSLGYDPDDNSSLEQFENYIPAIQLTDGLRTVTEFPVGGVGWVRLKTTSASGTGDPAAKAVFRVSRT